MYNPMKGGWADGIIVRCSVVHKAIRRCNRKKTIVEFEPTSN